MSHVCTFAAFRTIGYVFRKYNFIRKSALNAWLIANHCFWLQEAKERQGAYQKFYIEELFPEITNRYQEKHGEAFPMSGDNKEIKSRKNKVVKNWSAIYGFVLLEARQHCLTLIQSIL